MEKDGFPEKKLACVDYKGINICVQVNSNRFVTLKIDGVPRDTRVIAVPKGQAVILSSSVQTDYEWHEFITATVIIEEDMARVCVQANNQSILEQ